MHLHQCSSVCIFMKRDIWKRVYNPFFCFSSACLSVAQIGLSWVDKCLHLSMGVNNTRHRAMCLFLLFASPSCPPSILLWSSLNIEQKKFHSNSRSSSAIFQLHSLFLFKCSELREPLSLTKISTPLSFSLSSESSSTRCHVQSRWPVSALNYTVVTTYNHSMP